MAEYVKKELRLRELREALDELPPDQLEFADSISRLRRAEAAVLFCACLVEQAGLHRGPAAAQATLSAGFPNWALAHIHIRSLLL